jgi:uncharacterized protein (UPF0332 family)
MPFVPLSFQRAISSYSSMFHAARAILFSDGIEARAGTITSNKAIDATFKASSPRDDKRCGVVWHTQGSGKSLTMAF